MIKPFVDCSERQAMSKVTIRDVAREAGVGIGTVSRVINKRGQVSEKTRRKVEVVIEQLGFKPNPIARHLQRGVDFRTVGVVTRPFREEYYSFAERLRGVQKALRPYAEHYELTLYSLASTQDYEGRFNAIIETRAIDGLLLIDFDLNDEQKAMLWQQNIPFVGLNHLAAPDWLCIGANNILGGLLATQHLIELGHERIAYVGNERIDSDGFSTSNERFMGYQQALEEAGIPILAEYAQFGGKGFKPAHLMTRQLLRLPQPPTAIFAMSDTQALGCVAAAREMGLRVGQDLSVIGYDDLEISFHTGLSTVSQHLGLSGEMALNYLLQLLEDQANSVVPALPQPEVIIRDTTKPPNRNKSN